MKNNIKVMSTKPEVTDDEVRSLMNFNALLEKHRVTQKQKLSARKFMKGVVALSAIGTISFFTYWIVRPEEQIEIDSTTAKHTSQPEKVVVAEDSNSVVVNPQQSRDEKQVSVNDNKKSSAIGKLKTISPAKKHDVLPTTENNNSDAPVFVQAEPVEGYPSLYEYFSRELAYPASRLKDSISGVVSVVFTIAKDGRAEKISIEQSLGKEFDEEAIRLIQNMPQWKPATYNDKPMPSRISLPLTFQVKKIK